MTKERAYIFLDIDGVLNKSSQWRRMYRLDTDCIRSFAFFVKRHWPSHAIVLTSSWKNGFDPMNRHAPHIAELLDCLKPYGMSVLAKTPVLDETDRSLEINAFIRQHHLEDHPCIVFDDDESLFQKTRLMDCCTAYFLDAAKGFTEQTGVVSKGSRILRWFGIGKEMSPASASRG